MRPVKQTALGPALEMGSYLRASRTDSGLALSGLRPESGRFMGRSPTSASRLEAEVIDQTADATLPLVWIIFRLSHMSGA
jgi:hypothetical protein